MTYGWVQASRPLAQANIAVPLLFGQALAWNATRSFDLLWFAAIHVFGVLDHLLIVYANDVADEPSDRLNQSPTPFSGGSRVLVDGRLSAVGLAFGACIAAVALVVLTVAAAIHGRPLAPWFAGAAIFLLWAYSFGPLRRSYRGHGEWLQAAGVGVVLPLFAFYLQAGDLAPFPMWVLSPALLLGYAGNVLTAVPDLPADRRAQKRTFAVRFGDRWARGAAVLFLAIAGTMALGDRVLEPDYRFVMIGLVVLGLLVNVSVFLRQGASSEGSGGRQNVAFVVWNGGLAHATLLVWAAALVR